MQHTARHGRWGFGPRAPRPPVVAAMRKQKSVARSISTLSGMTTTAAEPPPSPVNHDHAIAQQLASEHLENTIEERSIYWPAQRLLEWGEVQHARHSEWSDLFYDLIMVAFAYQVGTFVKVNLTVPEGLLGLAGIGVTLVGNWNIIVAYARCAHHPRESLSAACRPIGSPSVRPTGTESTM